MLQVKSNLRSICSNLGQFDFFCFCGNQKKSFWLLRSSLHPPSSLYLHSTYLTYYSLPALPTFQPLFFLSRCLHVPCEPWTTYLWFSFGFMSWCLTIEPWKLGCKFNYTVVVINFLKLFKSDILIKENTPPIITHYYSKCTSALTIYKLILL